MTEQQITEFDRWFEQRMDPELNLTPGDKELCRHAWQAALSHAEGEAQCEAHEPTSTPHCPVCLLDERDELRGEVKRLLAEAEDADRILRASVPERHKGATSPIGAVQNYIAELEALSKAALSHAEGEAVEIEPPEFHSEGMGCGLEDRGITDRYEAMEYGFREAVEQYEVIIGGYGQLYTHPAPQVAVPGALTKYDGYVPPEDGSAGEYYVDGWNSCRDAMLAATPTAPAPDEREIAQDYEPVKPPRLKRDWKGATVRTQHEIQNGHGIIPAGSVGEITHQSPKGSTITFHRCGCCGVRPIVSHVGPDRIEHVRLRAGKGDE